jgi:hypothetical protein
VVQVVEVTPDPVSFTRAEGDIRKYLANRKVERLLEQIDAELRANAKIERFGLYRRH